MGDTSCGLHFCGKCGLLVLIFGIVYILAGLKMITVDPWLVLGVFFGLLGLMSVTGMGKMK